MGVVCDGDISVANDYNQRVESQNGHISDCIKMSRLTRCPFFPGVEIVSCLLRCPCFRESAFKGSTVRKLLAHACCFGEMFKVVSKLWSSHWY